MGVKFTKRENPKSWSVRGQSVNAMSTIFDNFTTKNMGQTPSSKSCSNSEEDSPKSPSGNRLEGGAQTKVILIEAEYVTSDLV